MPEVLGNEAGIAELLAQSCCCGVAQRVRRHVLLDPCALRGAADDVGEDRLLEPAAREPAEDRIARQRLACGADRSELAREAGARGGVVDTPAGALSVVGRPGNLAVEDFSSIAASGGTTTVTRLAGFANAPAVRIAVIDDSGQTLYSTPILGGLYSAASLPQQPANAIVGLDASNDVIYRRPLISPPTPQPAIPQVGTSSK